MSNSVQAKAGEVSSPSVKGLWSLTEEPGLSSEGKQKPMQT